MKSGLCRKKCKETTTKVRKKNRNYTRAIKLKSQGNNLKTGKGSEKVVVTGCLLKKTPQQQIKNIPASLLVLATHPNEFISLTSSLPLSTLKAISNAMSSGSNSFMLQCDWLQIRTTTHISTQVIIWISEAGGDGSRRVRDQTPEYLQINIRGSETHRHQPLQHSPGAPMSLSNHAAITHCMSHKCGITI